MESTIKVVPMSQRKYQMIPLEDIVVLNSRNREKRQFGENVQSIEALGMRVPIRVNSRNLAKTQHYDLICGEGRYLIYKKLGWPTIKAEVVDCDEKEAYLASLVDNMARVPHKVMEFAREVKRMHDEGIPLFRIGLIVGRHPTYVASYVQLVEQGEERLITGVEQGVFPITFATQVAHSDDAQAQNVLMDAFDSGLINSANITTVRKLVELRLKLGKTPDRRHAHAAPMPDYTLKDLTKDITRITKEKEGFVRETTTKENRLFMMLSAIKTLSEDPQWHALVVEAGVLEPPKLEGNYNGTTRQ